MGRADAIHLSLPFGFVSPDNASVGDIRLGALIAAITRRDQGTLAVMRTGFAEDADAFDRFVAGLRDLAAGDHAAAAGEFARLGSARWQVPTALMRAIALAASGDFGPAITLANQAGDLVRAQGAAGAASAASYPGDAALLREAIRCLMVAEAEFPAATGPLQVASPLCYLVGYPRSGNTLLTQFLSFAFAAPNYSVYPGDGWYFSRRFHDRAPGHRVFVKDHVLWPEYLENDILSPVRDGRNAMVSLARYLYAEGQTALVRRGELADFLSNVAERMPHGFWGEHTRALLDARDRGARIRLVPYEEFFGNYQRLLGLAHELADGAPVPCVDEEGYAAFVARWQRRLARQPQWCAGIALPDDSFLPQDWSIGGGTIDWRHAFDVPARRRFHDLGGTEMLLRLGYETDEGWWRNG